MQKVVLFFLAATIVAGSMSCKNAGFKKTTQGISYKIIRASGSGDAVDSSGTVIKFDYTYIYGPKDSLLRTSVGSMPNYQPIDSQRLPAPYYGIFSTLHKGDSLVLKQLTDSIFTKGREMPPFMKRGQYITSTFKVLDVFRSIKDAEPDAQNEAKLMKSRDSVKAIAQQVEDDKAIEAYLAKNNIKAVKAPKGTYVEIISSGAGEAADTGKKVGVNYTGRSMDDGVAFDSNTDTTFGHAKDTLKVNMGLPSERGGMITGFTDGLSLLHKGDKARLYIPSALAYGEHGREPKIKPNENLIFEIDVLSVVPTPKTNPMAMGMGGPGGHGGQQMSPEMMAKLKAMMQAQKGGQQAAPQQGH